MGRCIGDITNAYNLIKHTKHNYFKNLFRNYKYTCVIVFVVLSQKI